MSSTHDVWRRRWEALSDDILSRKVEIESRLRANPTAFDTYERNKIRAITETLTCLRQFANEYFYYFYDGFNDGTLTLTKLYSKEHVLTTILEQIGYDMETLSRIAHDHFAFAGEEALRKADFLADEALKLAMHEEWFPEGPPVMLSYFQKSPSIRVIPYANVFMLGIPYTGRVAVEDFLAIPHEVGHYVFWQGKLPDTTTTIARELFENAPKDPPWCFRWLEEMFADIYGAFVAGAFIALSFQELQLQSLPKRIVTDDQDHPTPNVRPYIYVKALKKIGSPKSASLLNKRWEKTLADLEEKHKPLLPLDKDGKGREVHKIYFGNNTNRPIHTIITEERTVEGAISPGLDLKDVEAEPIDAVMQKIVELFKKERDSDEWNTIVSDIETYISDNLSDKEDFIADNNHPYIRFRKFVKGISIESEREFDVRCRDLEELIEEWEKGSPEEQPPWFPVWYAGGWTTEGPKCEGSSGVC